MTRLGVEQRKWSEPFNQLPLGWTVVAGSGSVQTIVAIPNGSNNVYQSAGYKWIVYPDNIKFEPNWLYRVKIRVRRTATTDAPTQKLYVGLTGIAEDGVTKVDVSGGDNFSNQHNFVAFDFDMTTVPLNQWREFIAYFRGWAPAGSTGTFSDPNNPARLHALVRFFRPYFILNYNTGPAGNVMQVDGFQVEAIAHPALGQPIAFGPNVLQNPGFELGSSGWTDGGGFFFENDPTNAHSGSFRCRYQGAGAGGPNLIPSFQQPSAPGDRWYVAAWSKTAAGVGVSQLGIRWRRADGSQIQRDAFSVVTPTAAYTKFEILSPPAPAETAYAMFDWGENNSDNSSTPWYVDDCELRLMLPMEAQIEMVHLIEANFSGGSLYLSTGAADLSWNDREWEAIGGLLTFEGIQESAQGTRESGVQFQLAGVDQSIISVLLTNNFRGRPVRVWRAYLDRTLGKVYGTPLLLFEGLQLAPYEVTEERSRERGSVVIKMQAVGVLAVNKIRGIATNLTSHQHVFPGDTFFQNVAALANLHVYWGTTAPTFIGAGGGGGNSGGFGNNPDGTQMEY